MFSIKQDRSAYRILSACCILFLLQIKTRNFCFLSFVEGTINLNPTILIDTKNSSSDKSKIVDGSSDDNVIEKSAENSGCDQLEESGENSGCDQLEESGENSGCDQLEESGENSGCDQSEESGENSGFDQLEESGENSGCDQSEESRESSKQYLEPDVDYESNLYKILSVINNSTCNNKFAYARLKVKKVDWDELFEDSKVRCWQLIQLYNISTTNVTDKQYFEVVFKVPLVPPLVGTGVDFTFYNNEPIIINQNEDSGDSGVDFTFYNNEPIIINQNEDSGDSGVDINRVFEKRINKSGITNQNKTLNTSNLSPLTFCGTLPFCDNSANSACINTTIKSCNKCSLVNGILFMLFLVILGLVISIENMLIIAVVYRRHRKKKINKIDIIKMSLAIADLLTGKYNLLKNILLQTYYKRFIKTRNCL